MPCGIEEVKFIPASSLTILRQWKGYANQNQVGFKIFELTRDTSSF